MAKYVVEYESKAGPGAVIDGTYLPDLKGWPAPHNFDLPARDADAVRLTKEWYSGVGKDLSRQSRYMVGEPRLLKIITLDWKD